MNLLQKLPALNDRNISIGFFILIMLSTTKGGTIVYSMVSPHDFGLAFLDNLYGWLIVLVLDLSVIYLSTRGEEELSGIAGIAIAAMSFISFIPDKTPLENLSWKWWIGAVIFSVIFPILQWYFAKLFSKEIIRLDEVERLRRELFGEKEAAREFAAQAAQDVADLKNRLGQMDILARANQGVNEALRDEMEELRENYKKLLAESETLRPLLPYKSLYDALQVGKVVMGRNKNIIPREWTTEKGVSLPFDIVNNNSDLLQESD